MQYPFASASILVAVLALGIVTGGSVVTSAHAQPGYTSDQTYTSDDPSTDAFFGSALVKVGNSGGVPILAVGAPNEENTSNSRLEGFAYLVNGSTNNVIATMETRNSTNGGDFGQALGVISDVTGDGFPDVVVGAPSEDVASSDEGYAYIYNGQDGSYVRTLQTGGGNIESGRNFGASVSGIGDVTGDNVPDVVVGAPGQTVNGTGFAGKVYVFNGDNGNVIDVLTGAEISTGRFGASVVPAGDLTGDNTPDFAVGAPGEGSGQVYLIDGGTVGGTVSMDDFTSGNPETGGKFGASLDTLEGGSDPDFIVGAPAEDVGGTNEAGRAYFVDGASIGGTVSRTSLVTPNPELSGQFGAAVAGIVDRSGDGSPDVVVGAPTETVDGTSLAGRVYVVDRSDGTVLAAITSPSVEDGQFGSSVAATGHPLIGAPREDVNTDGQAGRVHSFAPTIALVDGRDDANGGTDFTASPTPDTDENAVGRFELSAAVTGTSLDAVTVENAAATTPTGVNSIELWASTDDTFEGSGTDMELQSKSYSNSVTFSGFGGHGIPSGSTYLFVVMDLASDADAQYEPVITSDADLTFSGGPLAEYNGTQTSSFTNAYLSSASTALPVELTMLEAMATGEEAVTVRWATASETNNASFNIQRRVKASRRDASTRSSKEKADGWHTAGTIPGAGTTTEPQSYEFTDEDLPYAADVVQYRLRQVDTDGTAHLSDVVTVERGAPDRLELLGTYPNPARTQATVRLAVPDAAASDDATLWLYDVMGRRVRTVDGVSSGRSTVSFNVSDLSSGVYVLRLSAGGTTRTQRLTVMR